MSIVSFIISIILISGAILLYLLPKTKNLNKRIEGLEKEVDIQSNTLNFEKTQSAESLNRLHSITIIIMEIIQEISSALSKETEDLEKEVLSVIFEKTKSLLKVKKGVLLKVNPKDNCFIPLFTFGFQEKDLENFHLPAEEKSSLAGWSALTGRIISIYDVQRDPAIRHLLDKDSLHCHYFLPLKVDKQVMALICLGQIEEALPPLLADRLFSILSNIGAVALRDAILTQQLRQQSIRDGLTGLYNHSYFQKWLQDTLINSLQNRNSVILAMLDLDDFKKINDTHGHPVGDIALKRVAHLLQNLFTSGYICARYGGEEFILGFVGKDFDEVLQAAEKLRQNIAQEKVNIAGHAFQFTASIGLADARLKNGSHLNRQELIERVDKALYKAKFSGKNKVVMAEA